MKFAVFSDLHYDVIPDADRRLDIFMEAVKREHAEFIIDLGDLCFPKRENQKVLDKLNSCGVPCFHNIGNHNSDKDSLININHFFGVKKSYFSFVWKDVKFINLDANYINKGSRFEPFYKCNYQESEDQFPYIPPFEIEWLVDELKSNYKYFVILSHQSLANNFMKRGISNRETIQKILESAESDGKRILICMNGHDHGTDCRVINGITYYTVNSMSYIWQNSKEVFCYSKELHDQYPYLKNMILYEEPLYSMVTIDEYFNVIIDGINSQYQKYTPKDVGLGNTYNGVYLEPNTKSCRIERLTLLSE